MSYAKLETTTTTTGKTKKMFGADIIYFMIIKSGKEDGATSLN